MYAYECSPFCETFRRPRMKMRGKTVGQRLCAYVKSSGGGVGGIVGRSMQAGSLWCREVVVQQESDADSLHVYIFSSSSVLPDINSHRYVAGDRKRGVDGIEM